MTELEAVLFLATPALSLAIGYAIGRWGLRRGWSVSRSQAVATLSCLMATLVVFFGIEFQAIIAAGRGFAAALEGAAATAAVLALACVPLAPIPAFIGAHLAFRNAVRRDDP